MVIGGPVPHFPIFHFWTSESRHQSLDTDRSSSVYYIHLQSAKGIPSAREDMAPGEPEVRFFSPMPPGYVFVPKGDVYITKNCRQKTYERGQTVYVVVNKHNKIIGLRCPQSVFSAVEVMSEATAAKRADAVDRRDAAARDRFEEALGQVFPRMPLDDVKRVLQHALKKRSGRVGRTETHSLEHKAKLAVLAHIRHRYTNYDQLLNDGKDRDNARSVVLGDVNDISTKWGGPSLVKHDRGQRKKRGRAAMSDSGKSNTSKRGGVARKAVVVKPGPRMQTRHMRKAASLPNGGRDEPIEISDSDDGAFSVSDELSSSSSGSDEDSDWGDSDD